MKVGQMGFCHTHKRGGALWKVLWVYQFTYDGWYLCKTLHANLINRKFYRAPNLSITFAPSLSYNIYEKMTYFKRVRAARSSPISILPFLKDTSLLKCIDSLQLQYYRKNNYYIVIVRKWAMNKVYKLLMHTMTTFLLKFALKESG